MMRVSLRHPSLRSLSEYASGSLEESLQKKVSEHVRKCVRCSNRVESLAHLDSTLSTTLATLDVRSGGQKCLAPVVLADYVEGLLSRDQRACADEHLAICESCRSTLVDIRRSIEGLDENLELPGDELQREVLGNMWAGISSDRLKCPVCDQQNERGACACLRCGTQLNKEAVTLLCICCLQPVPSNSRFCPTCGAAMTPPKKALGFLYSRGRTFPDLIRTHVWLVLAVASLGISFLTRQFILQSIVLSLIFGAKWILNQMQFRIYGEMLNLLRKKEEEEEEEESKKRLSGGR